MDTRCAVIVVTLLSAAVHGAISEPPDRTEPVPSRTFGDAENIRLLAGLLNDADILVREQAIRDLGETHNLDAMGHLQAASRDTKPLLRIAATDAAAELSPARAGKIITEALKSPNRSVALAGLRNARRVNLLSQRDAIAALLSRSDPAIQAAALETLSAMGLPAPAGDLARLLASDHVAVRLRAAENAIRLEKADELVDKLTPPAVSGPPAVRGAAIAALGKFDFAGSRSLLDAAAGDANPLVRRGALRAFRNAAQAQAVRAFLDDPCDLVRLAAIRAAGQLRCTESIGRLFELMLQATDDLSHLAARQSLAHIGTSDVSDRAAAELGRLYPAARQRLTADPAERTRTDDPHHAMMTRNVRSCCWLLGELRSDAALALLLASMSELPQDSDVLIDSVAAIGKIGDPRAVGPLITFLQRCHTDGIAHFRDILARAPAVTPYSQAVTASAIEAAGRLQAKGAVDVIVLIARGPDGQSGLIQTTAIAMKVLPGLTDDQVRKAVGECIVYVLRRARRDRVVAYMAAKAAGKLKLAEALPLLRQMAFEDRQCLALITAAAWAIQEITGQTPEVPNPVALEGDWIVRKPWR